MSEDKKPKKKKKAGDVFLTIVLIAMSGRYKCDRCLSCRRTS